MNKYTLAEVFEFPVGTRFKEKDGNEIEIIDMGDGDKALIGLWLEEEDKTLNLTSIWMHEEFTKVEDQY